MGMLSVCSAHVRRGEKIKDKNVDSWAARERALMDVYVCVCVLSAMYGSQTMCTPYSNSTCSIFRNILFIFFSFIHTTSRIFILN